MKPQVKDLPTTASTSRERLIATLDHQQPDRIPIDIGGTAVAGIHTSCVAALRDQYGLEKRPVRVHEPFQMLGMLDEDLRQAMGLDVIDLYFPYYKGVNDWIHSHTSWKTFKHSCGAVSKFLPSFIEAGFDILNPVQCSAAGMQPEQLKAKFGDRIVFWGGGVDTEDLAVRLAPGCS